MWYPLILNYLKDSPHGKAHGYEGLEDVIAHFQRRRQLERRIIQEIIKEDCLILKAKEDGKIQVSECCRFANLDV